MKKLLTKIRKYEAGATAIEYGLIAGLIAVAIVSAVTATGNNTATVFNKIASKMTVSAR